MRITRLKLENFRGFKSLQMDFHKDLTVLVGINGSGKTTILDALGIALGYVTVKGGYSLDTKDLHANAKHSLIDISFYTDDSRDEFQEKIEIERDKGVQQVVEKKRFDIDSLNRKEGPLPLVCYYRVNRHAVDATPGSKDPSYWEASFAWNNSLVNPDTNFQKLFTWFREREDLENQEYRENSDYIDPQLSAVRKALESLLPGYSKPRVRRPKIGSDPKNVALKKPVLAITKDGKELAFDQLSEGERTMAALTCDIARRLAIANPKSDNPLNGEGVVLIDEVDLHLHPEWQRKAIPSLRRTFPNIQFVVATHSPLVLGHVPAECVRILEDFAVVEAPPTEGRDPNSLFLEVFDVPLRKESTEKQINSIADLIDKNNLAEAREQLDTLGKSLGEGDAEYIRLNTLIAMLED